MLNIVCRYLMFLPLFSCLSIFATEVHHLDESLVPVESRANNVRAQAIVQAFKNVVLKNTGTQRALTAPEITKQLGNASAMMTQYGYQEIDGKLFIKVSFDHQRVIRLLRQAGLPVWGKQRPLTLLWIVEQTGGERVILNDMSTSAVHNAFDIQSADRGVPLLFPLMDLDDAMLVGVNDIRGQFVDNVAGASLRYQADFFIIGTISFEADRFNYQISLYPSTLKSGGSQTTPLAYKEGHSGSIEHAVKAMTTVISEYYAAQYGVVDSGESLNVQVSFTDLNDMSQLVQLERYLKQLSAIKVVNIAEIKGDTVTFNLSLFGHKEDLFRLFALDPRMSPVSKEATLPASQFEETEQKEPARIYYWKG
ncbi:DUF2066 domain-containing protein [Shewanella sp.]|nr:DUF2066 domain-containing protein [Shewanella sp.]